MADPINNKYGNEVFPSFGQTLACPYDNRSSNSFSPILSGRSPNLIPNAMSMETAQIAHLNYNNDPQRAISESSSQGNRSMSLSQPAWNQLPYIDTSYLTLEDSVVYHQSYSNTVRTMNMAEYRPYMNESDWIYNSTKLSNSSSNGPYSAYEHAESAVHPSLHIVTPIDSSVTSTEEPSETMSSHSSVLNDMNIESMCQIDVTHLYSFVQSYHPFHQELGSSQIEISNAHTSPSNSSNSHVLSSSSGDTDNSQDFGLSTPCIIMDDPNKPRQIDLPVDTAKILIISTIKSNVIRSVVQFYLDIDSKVISDQIHGQSNDSMGLDQQTYTCTNCMNNSCTCGESTGKTSGSNDSLIHDVISLLRGDINVSLALDTYTAYISPCRLSVVKLLHPTYGNKSPENAMGSSTNGLLDVRRGFQRDEIEIKSKSVTNEAVTPKSTGITSSPDTVEISYSRQLAVARSFINFALNIIREVVGVFETEINSHNLKIAVFDRDISHLDKEFPSAQDSNYNILSQTSISHDNDNDHKTLKMTVDMLGFMRTLLESRQHLWWELSRAWM